MRRNPGKPVRLSPFRIKKSYFLLALILSIFFAFSLPEISSPYGKLLSVMGHLIYGDDLDTLQSINWSLLQKIPEGFIKLCKVLSLQVRPQ